jgi:hypothetical protein
MTKKTIATQILERKFQKQANPFGSMNLFSGDSVAGGAKPAAIKSAPVTAPPVPGPKPALQPQGLGNALQQAQTQANQLSFKDWHKNPGNLPPPTFNAANYPKDTLTQRAFGGLTGYPTTEAQQHQQAVNKHYGDLLSTVSSQNPSWLGRMMGYENNAHPQDVEEASKFIHSVAPDTGIVKGTPGGIFGGFTQPGAGMAAAQFARSPAGLNIAQQIAQTGSRVVNTPSGATAILGGAAAAPAVAAVTAGLPQAAAPAAQAGSAVGQLARAAVPVAGVVGGSAALNAAGVTGENIADSALPAAQQPVATQAPPQAAPQDGTQAAQAQAQQPAESKPIFDPQRSPSAQIAKNDQAASQPAPAFDAEAASKQYQAAKTPEERNAAIQGMAKQLQTGLSGADATGAQHVMAGDFNTPEAKTFIDNKLGPAGDEFLKQMTAGNPQDPNLWGQAAGMWESLGTAGQIAFSIGVPMALLGMIGGSGITTLLGALGIGAAGLMGASGGLFGQDAQNSVNSAIGGLGKSLAPMLGINLPNETDIKTRLTAAAEQSPEQAQAELAKVRAEVEPYARFSPEAQKFLTDSADPNYMYNQAKNYATENFAQLADERMANPEGRTWTQYAGKLLGLKGEDANKPGTWSSYLMGAPDTATRAQNVEESLAQKGWKRAALQVMHKAARCWAGYEPVPGKKPYSNDSCRPIGGKKKKKKTEKKAVDGYTGAYSNRPFDVEHAAKMFKMPAKNPQLVYNRMMNTWKQNKFSPAQFSEMRQKYDGLPPAFNTTGQPPVAAQPAPTPPQQAVKPAAPTASPSATPVAPPSLATAPKPAPQNRPTMTQMPPQTGPMPPSSGATAYIKSVRGGRR